MQAIFDADQHAREKVMQSETQDWSTIEADDAQRRSQTRELLKEGQLHTGRDFRLAAFVFQHGTRPDDYLLAHTLAIVALTQGDVEARWIAAATLDRYVHAAGKPQIFGTGFDIRDGTVAHEGPFNGDLISDDLRRALGVPPVAEQVHEYEAARQRMAK